MTGSLCVAVWAHTVPHRHFRPSQLCTNSPSGSSGLSHLLSVCWASSNLAASNGVTGALSVSSPLDCQKSSVRSPYWLAHRAPRKLTRLGRDWHWQEPFLRCNGITITKTLLCNPCQSVRGSWRPPKKWNQFDFQQDHSVSAYSPHICGGFVKVCRLSLIAQRHAS